MFRAPRRRQPRPKPDQASQCSAILLTGARESTSKFDPHGRMAAISSGVVRIVSARFDLVCIHCFGTLRGVWTSFPWLRSRSGPDRSRPVLELSQESCPSIERGATQMARNLTSLGIELGRALCWGRVSGAHFWYKDKAACRSFFVFFYPRTCVNRFSSQAIKSTLIASAISPGNAAIVAIFA